MRAECRRAAAGYALALPRRPFAGRIGDRLGRGVGSSIEFMDFRDYQLGDDLRHVDWRTFARTDQLKVRLYREEVAPVLDCVVDGSASMASSELKAVAVRDLVAAAGFWVGKTGGALRVHVPGRGLVEGDRIEFAGAQLPLRSDLPLRPRGLRMLISDFLFAADPGPDIRALAAGCSHLWVLQVLDAWELDPTPDGPRTLIDCEDATRADLVLDEAAVARYRDRLTHLARTVADAARSAGGRYARVRAQAPEAMFRTDLLTQAIVEAA